MACDTSTQACDTSTVDLEKTCWNNRKSVCPSSNIVFLLTLKYYVYAHFPHPGAPPKFLTPPRPATGCFRPTCKVSALYLENCANALRQKDRDRDRQTILFIDIYIYKEDCLSLSLSLSVSMHSHSFQATKFKLHRNVNEYPGQVVEGLTILLYPQGLENEGLITQST